MDTKETYANQLQYRIASTLLEIDEIPSDWQNMTLRSIFCELDKVPGYRVFWGCWNENELNTVFQG